MCTYFVAVAFRRLHRTGVENDLKEAGNRTEVSQNTFQEASSPCWRGALEAWLLESLVHFGKRLQINEIGSSRTQDRANIMGVWDWLPNSSRILGRGYGTEEEDGSSGSAPGTKGAAFHVCKTQL